MSVVMMRRLVAYFPLMIVATLFFWPDIMVKMDSKTFPIIGLMGFSVRITELLFLLLIGMLLLNLNEKKSSNRVTIVFSRKLRTIYALVVFCFVLITCAAVQGVISGNPIVMLDLRGIFYGFFVIVFCSIIKSIDQFKTPFKFFYISLIILACSNFLSVFTGSGSLVGGYAVGGYSNITIMMTLYLYCLAMAFSIYFVKKRRIFLGTALLAFMSCILSLQKQALLGVLVGLIVIVLLLKSDKKGPFIRKGVIFFGLAIIGVFVVVSSSSLFSSIFGVSPEVYISSRILREDVGDISGGRFDMWSQIVNDAIANPLIGRGLGVEGFTFDTIEIPVHEHNIIMWSLRRFSIAGTFFFVLLAIKFFSFSKAVYQKETDPFKQALLLASLTYGVVYFITNMVILLPFVFEPAIIFWLCGSIIFIIHREQIAIDKIVVEKLNIVNK